MVEQRDREPEEDLEEGDLQGESIDARLRVPLWLFVALASAWGALVLGTHILELPVPYSQAVAGAAQALSAARGLTAGLLQEHVAVLSCVLLTLVAAMTAGRGLLSLLKADSLPSGERLLFSAALGFGALSYAMLLLAALGWLSTVGAWSAVGSLAALGILRAARTASKRSGRRTVRRRARLPFLDRMALGALLLHAGITLVGALAPLVFYDSLAYHFSAPHLSMLNRQLMPMPGDAWIDVGSPLGSIDRAGQASKPMAA